MKNLVFILVLLTSLLFPTIALAEETMVFDSTNHYLGGCQLTDTAEWNQEKDINVSRFQVWYSWGANETELPVTIYFDGEEFAKFTAKRSECDPYQQQWCNADFPISKIFPKGSYKTTIPTKKMCLKPGETGTIRLYTNEGAETVSTSTPTPSSSPLLTPTPNAPVAATVTIPSSCSCTKTVIITSALASLASSLFFHLVFKKK